MGSIDRLLLPLPALSAYVLASEIERPLAWLHLFAMSAPSATKTIYVHLPEIPG